MGVLHRFIATALSLPCLACSGMVAVLPDAGVDASADFLDADLGDAAADAMNAGTGDGATGDADRSSPDADVIDWRATCDGRRPTVESCNGADDDCDGSTDEGTTRRCGSVEDCTAGWVTCVDGTYGECVPMISSSVQERCDGLDTDCNGLIDDGLTDVPCGTDVGICARGIRTCFGGRWSDCEGEIQPDPRDPCNGLDDDCDGFVDEDFHCTMGTTWSCPTSCGSTGMSTCGWDLCWGPCVPPPEVCGNLVDDDCDIMIDESCPGP